jgi:hypothetical protein
MGSSKTRPPFEAEIVSATFPTSKRLTFTPTWIKYFTKQHQNEATLLTPGEVEAILMTSRSH